MYVSATYRNISKAHSTFFRREGFSIPVIFHSIINIIVQLSTQWKEMIAEKGAPVVVNSPRFFSRFFLDVIGEGVNHKIHRQYHTLLTPLSSFKLPLIINLAVSLPTCAYC
jgi:hypothetical protein